MVKGVLLATNISLIEELVTFISENGIMLVISAVVVYFLIRVLNAMLDQNSQLVSKVLPEVTDIEESITELMVKYNEAEARHNLLINKQFSEVQSLEKDILNRLKSINKELASINSSLKDLSDEIEKQHLYIDFYQEQLKKEKG